MALIAFRAPCGHMQGTVTQVMLNASLGISNAADGARRRNTLGSRPLTGWKPEWSAIIPLWGMYFFLCCI